MRVIDTAYSAKMKIRRVNALVRDRLSAKVKINCIKTPVRYHLFGQSENKLRQCGDRIPESL